MRDKESGRVPQAEPGSREPSQQAVSAASGFDPSRRGPLPMDLYERLSSDRERALHAIADCIDYWIWFVRREYEGEKPPVTADTHVMLNGYENAPPFWPTMGQLAKWLQILRASPELLSDSDGSPKGGDACGSVRSTTARAGTASPKTSPAGDPNHG